MAKVSKKLEGRVGVGGKGSPTKAHKGMVEKPTTPDMIEKFVEAVVLKGMSKTDAYALTHPKSEAKNETMRVLACNFAAKPEVKARMEEVTEELKARHAAFRDRLVGYHIEEIDRVYQEEHSLSNCMEQVKSISKIMGYEQKTLKVDATVGAMDESALEDKLAFLMGKSTN